LAAAPCPAQTLVIGLYDYANLSAKEIGRLTETASLALADSGIHIDWVYCRGALDNHLEAASQPHRRHRAGAPADPPTELWAQR